MTSRNREPRPIWTPDHFPSVGDWKRTNNDRLSTTKLELPTPDFRKIVLFYSYRIPIAFTEWNDGVRCGFFWWTPPKNSPMRSVTLMKHLKQIQTSETQLVETVPYLRDCGQSIDEFRKYYQACLKSPFKYLENTHE